MTHLKLRQVEAASASPRPALPGSSLRVAPHGVSLSFRIKLGWEQGSGSHWAILGLSLSALSVLVPRVQLVLQEVLGPLLTSEQT